VLHPHDQVRIGDERQIFERFLQVARTYLAGSPGPVDGFGEAHSGFLIHGQISSFPASIPAAGERPRGVDNLPNHDRDCQGKKFIKLPRRCDRERTPNASPFIPLYL
jgi:hypothetical protein